MDWFLRICRSIVSFGVVIAVIAFALWSIDLSTNHRQSADPSLVQTLSNVAMGPPNTDNALYLPIVSHQYNPRLAMRIGFGATFPPITRYPEIRSLNAGWYVNWSVSANPVRPAGMDYVQMIRVHQKIVETDGCGIYVTADRRKCPYVEPYTYEYKPDAATIQAAAIANPGSIWLLGNEIDRLDWNGFGQDEMVPELYAVAYKELYDIIKAVDPQARVAIAGVIQATPMRLRYLTRVWDEYRNLYGTDMPVDIWNVHNFILTENCFENGAKDDEIECWGAGVVPGENPLRGDSKTVETHLDRTIFDEQIRAFRQWMKDRGQQAKPLIVTEYGVLYAEPQFQNPQVVQDFMLWSFDYFLNTRDCELSTIDDCRLVQQWLWFSLDHEAPDANLQGNLVDRTTRQLLPAGIRFKEYTDANYKALSVGY